MDQRYRRKVVVGVVALLAALGAALWWWQARKYEATDDAQIDGHIYPISARIHGHICGVTVEEGQWVQAGAVLVRIDPRDYEVTVDHTRAAYDDAVAAARAAALAVPVTRVSSSSAIADAEAELESARTGVGVAIKRLEQERAALDAARSAAKTAESDVRRYAALLEKHEVAQQQYDRAKTAGDDADAKASAADAGTRAAEDQVAQARAHVRQCEAALARAQVSPKDVSATEARAAAARAKVESARAALARAKLDLGYTTIVSPVDGIVGRRAAHVGQNVQPGQDLMAIVPLDDVWVTANFKEDQLALMRPGQAVAIDVDAYGRAWRGRVTSIGGATGARYSVLPPENATGNYVKVVQRVPVRIDFVGDANRDRLLRPGMSVAPRVRVR